MKKHRSRHIDDSLGDAAVQAFWCTIATIVGMGIIAIAVELMVVAVRGIAAVVGF